MILSDRSLRERLAFGSIKIEPYDETLIQPSSIDVRLDDRFICFINDGVIDVKKSSDRFTYSVSAGNSNPFRLEPGQFALGSTLESVTVPDDLVGRIEGKSSLGRLGLLIHATAGFVDAGWTGQLTLEFSNVSPLPILLYPGMKIGQISFMEMTTPAENPYGRSINGSKYQGQDGPVTSRYNENFK